MIDYAKMCSNSNMTGDIHSLAMGKKVGEKHTCPGCGKLVKVMSLGRFGSPLSMIPRHNKKES